MLKILKPDLKSRTRFFKVGAPWPQLTRLVKLPIYRCHGALFGNNLTTLIIDYYGVSIFGVAIRL